MPSARKAARQPSRAEAGTAAAGLRPIVLTVALLAARFLIPPESSIDGETLWIVQLWLIAGVVCVWHRFLNGRPLLRLDLPALAVGLLLVGHLLSGGAVLLEGGNKRTAINVMWEWGGLAVTFYALRTVLYGRAERVRITWVLTSLVVVLAGFGLYQHYVSFPQTAAEYREKRSQLDALLTARSRGGTRTEVLRREKRIAELGGWMVENGVPLDGPGRRQWEDRLHSTEPFGTFALANTFAGLLAAALFPALAFLVSLARARERWFWLAMMLAAVGVIAWCLILTKSRTAWAGCVAGGVVWWLCRRATGGGSRRLALWLLGGAAALAAGVAAVAFTGGLDAAVVSEAPKSLQYRLQYWNGTAGVLRESPLLGPGPGNFRQHYLKHKLPESSEEIRDPHNLFLDVWCSGGLIALAGLLALIAAVAMSRVGRTVDAEFDEMASPTGNVRWYAGEIVGFLFVLGASWFLNTGYPGRDAILLCASVVVTTVTSRVVRRPLTAAPLLAGSAALLVHLCGAGGIEMPAIAQVLLVFAAALSTRSEPAAGLRAAATESRARLAGAFAASALFAVLFGACLSWATIPVITRVAAVSTGRHDWLIDGNFRAAQRQFERAAVNDPLSPDPPRQMADLLHARWKRTPLSTDQLEAAIESQRIAISLDPRAYSGYQNLGRWQVDLYEATKQPAAIERAVAAYDRAVALYPHNAQLLSEQVTALALSGRHRRAAEAARQALEQDDVNHRAGHADKYLPANIRKKLQALAKPV